MNKIPCSFVAYSFFYFSFLISLLSASTNAGFSSRTLTPCLYSLLYSPSSVAWPNAAPALSTLRLEAFGHLSPALCPLSLSRSLSLSPSAAPDPDAAPDADADAHAHADADAAAERACFLMDFWLMFWALLWVPAGPTSLLN